MSLSMIRGRERLIPTILLIALAACGSGTDDATPSSSPPASSPAASNSAAAEGTGYCDRLLDAAQVLDDGGSESDYDELLLRVAAESPSDHAETWRLMSELSEEPFTYDNFNPAIDSLDSISDDLNTTCPGLDLMIVDDDGRMRMQPGG